MARAGLSHIEFGTDSFCDEVLEAYGKGFYFEDILQASTVAQAENVDYCHFLIAGGPGETIATLREGFERSKKLPGAVMMAVVGMRIYPGTELFSRAVADGRFLQPEEITDAKLNKVRLLNEIAQSRGQSMAQLALAWVLRLPQMTSALIGASKVSQIEDAAATVQHLDLSADESRRIEEILAA